MLPQIVIQERNRRRDAKTSAPPTAGIEGFFQSHQLPGGSSAPWISQSLRNASRQQEQEEDEASMRSLPAHVVAISAQKKELARGTSISNFFSSMSVATTNTMHSAPAVAEQRKTRNSLDSFLSMMSVALGAEELPEENRSVVSFGGRINDLPEMKTVKAKYNKKMVVDEDFDASIIDMDASTMDLEASSEFGVVSVDKKKRSSRRTSSRKENRKDRLSRKSKESTSTSVFETKVPEADTPLDLPKVQPSKPPSTSKSFQTIASSSTKSSPATTRPVFKTQVVSRPSLGESMRDSLRSLIQIDMHEEPRKFYPSTPNTESEEELTVQMAKQPILSNHTAKAVISSLDDECDESVVSASAKRFKPLKSTVPRASLSLGDHFALPTLTAISGGLNDESSVTPSMADNAKMIAATTKNRRSKKEKRPWRKPDEKHENKPEHQSPGKDSDNEPNHVRHQRQQKASQKVPPKPPRPSIGDHLALSIRSFAAMGDGLNDESSVTPSMADNVKMMAATKEKNAECPKEKRYWRKAPTEEAKACPSAVDIPGEETKEIEWAKTSMTGSPRVSFGNVEYREYNLVVGDNPSCSDLLPVSLGWDYGPKVSITIDDFENDREQFEQKPADGEAGCRRLKWHERRQLLIGIFGYTEQELRKLEMAFAEANGRTRASRFKQTKDWFLRSRGRGQILIATKKHNSIAGAS
jgi:hypothetical protein